jgi:hypothetical protein
LRRRGFPQNAIGIGGRALAADFAEKDPERDFL